MSSSRWRTTSPWLAAIVLTATCGATAPTRAAVDGGRTVHVQMSDFSFDPPRILLQSGEVVTLVFRNVGALEHEFMAGREVMAGHGYMKDWLISANASGVTKDADHVGLSVRVAPRATTKVTLTVPQERGQIEFGCFVAGHYENGMRGLLVVAGVQPASSPLATPTTTPAGRATPPASPTGHGMDVDEEQH